MENDKTGDVEKKTTKSDDVKCRSKTIVINLILLIFLIVLLVLLPLIVGLLVWYVRYDEIPSINDVINTTTTTPVPEIQPWQQFRLSGNVIPSKYHVTLYPDFYDNSTVFTGKVKIQAKIVTNDTKLVIIHANGLEIHNTEIRDVVSNASYDVSWTFPYKEMQYCVIEMVDTINKGTEVEIRLQFTGSLTQGLDGLYKSTYVNRDTGETRHLVTSKFEPISARKAFPCFDEPGYKAKFTVTLTHKPEYTALSNMPVQKAVPRSDGLIDTTFQESVTMSTYLVIFTVCDFSQMNTTTDRGTLVRVWASPDKHHQLPYSLKMASFILRFFEKMFGIDYPLPKLDMIALPDFYSGAMEHWGLISYRETSMLYDSENSSPGNQLRVAYIIAHEIIHMWFGNLVTMEWFDNIWLNEGFATYFQYQGVNAFHKDWHWDISGNVHSVINVDSSISTKAIVRPLESFVDLRGAFNRIVYRKGAAMLVMLENVIGRATLMNGLRAYLTKYQYKNTVTAQLWEELSKAFNCSGCVETLMNDWVTKRGFPYVDIKYVPNGNGTTTVTASQERFLYKAEGNETSERTIWRIPLYYITSNSTQAGLVWLNDTSVSFPVALDSSNPDSWIKFNPNYRAMYRVNYPLTTWDKFAKLLSSSRRTSLTPVDRAGLVSDVINLEKAGLLTITTSLDVMKYVHAEDNYEVWMRCVGELVHVSYMLRISPEYGRWKKFVVSLVEPVLRRLDWTDGGSHKERPQAFFEERGRGTVETKLRSKMISMSCYHGSTYCLTEARAIYVKWIRNETHRISPGIRSVIYKYGVVNGGTADEWDVMWARYNRARVPQEVDRLMAGMARSQQIWLIHRFLHLVLTSKTIREQDVFKAMRYVTYNDFARETMWTWMKRNWKKIVKRYTLHRHLLRALSAITDIFNTQQQLDEVMEFGKRHSGVKPFVENTLVPTIRANIAWMKRNRDVIASWLRKNA